MGDGWRRSSHLATGRDSLDWSENLTVATKTESIPTSTNQSVTETFQAYVRQLPDDTKQQAQPEIAKFVRWVGGERTVGSLTASEIGEFSDAIASRTSSAGAAERAAHVKQYLAFLKKKGLISVNLSQHLRLRKSRTALSVGRANRDSTGRVVRLTRSGFNDLTKKLADLQEERVRLVEEIHKAAADKDVRENAPLEAARESQGMIMARITELEATLKASVIIDDNKPDRKTVRIGSSVKLKDSGTGSVTGYQLVEPNEANPLTGKISIASPVGAAILGRDAGEDVKVNTPRGEQSYQIVSTG